MLNVPANTNFYFYFSLSPTLHPNDYQLTITIVCQSFLLTFSILTNDYFCYMPVHKLASISFSIIPFTSPSLSITYRLTVLLIVLTIHHILTYCHFVPRYFIPFFIPDLFHPFYVPSIIPQFCGWIIIAQHFCILVARQLAYCLHGLMICFLSNTLLFYLEYFLYHYLRS